MFDFRCPYGSCRLVCGGTKQFITRKSMIVLQILFLNFLNIRKLRFIKYDEKKSASV